MMYVRIAEGDMTAAARIRDAAIRCYARHGFEVGLRAIAEEAGVSLGLIRHHFGSKDGLRAACDARVLWLMEELGRIKTGASSPIEAAFGAMKERPELEPAVHYLLRGLAAGGVFARTFVDSMVDSLTAYLNKGEAEGTIRPSVAPEARARYLVLSGVGGMLMHFLMAPTWEHSTWSDYSAASTLPSLELYTQGLLADRSMLDAYMTYMKDPPASTAPSSA